MSSSVSFLSLPCVDSSCRNDSSSHDDSSRELDMHPDVLLGALPNRPSHFAAMPGYFAPRPRTRKMIGMMSVILAGILLIMLGYLAVGVSGYLAFPRTVSSNALNNFADDDILMQVRSRGIVGPGNCRCTAFVLWLAKMFVSFCAQPDGSRMQVPAPKFL